MYWSKHIFPTLFDFVVVRSLLWDGILVQIITVLMSWIFLVSLLFISVAPTISISISRQHSGTTWERKFSPTEERSLRSLTSVIRGGETTLTPKHQSKASESSLKGQSTETTNDLTAPTSLPRDETVSAETAEFAGIFLLQTLQHKLIVLAVPFLLQQETTKNSPDFFG